MRGDDLLEGTGALLDFGDDHPWHPSKGLFTIDDKLSFRPGPNNEGYGPHGAKKNDYPVVKPDAVKRVVCLGDSVTEREKIVQALRSEIDPSGKKYEFWALGVGGYGTRQELEYFRRYGISLAPDHVLLTFSFNDYEVTPVIMIGPEGEVLRFASNNPRRINPWLLRHSYIYRAFLQLDTRAPDRQEAVAAVEGALRELKEECDSLNIGLTVIVQPLLFPENLVEPELEEKMLEQHAQTLAMLAELQIPAWDLLPTVEAARAAGITLGEVEFDVHHPTDDLAQMYVEMLTEEGSWWDFVLGEL